MFYKYKHRHVIFASSRMLPPPTTIALIMRINDITSEQSRLELELANLSRELSGRPVKQQPTSHQHPHQHQDQHQDRGLVNIIDNSSIIATTVDNKKRNRGRPRKDTGTIVSSPLSNINIINNTVNFGDENLRMNYDRDIGSVVINGADDIDDGTYYFVDCGRVFICNSGGMLFDMKTRELVGWRNTYLNRVDFVDII